jgi:mono/diheme cytochrome c family protein
VRWLLRLAPASILLAAAVAGCYTGGSVVDGAVSAGAGSANGGTTTSVDGTEAAPVVTGLPCDVAAVVASRCVACHGEKLLGGAPNRITSYDDLVAVTGHDGDLTVAEVSVARMKDTESPMPPSGATPEDTKVIAAWVAAGMPEGSCDSSVALPAPAPLPPSEYDAAPVCTSKKLWTRGDQKSQLMHPGVGCVACHAKERGAPKLKAAGTVYPTAHEPDDCNGTGTEKPTTIEIKDANGKVYTETVNAAGNFFFTTARYPLLKMPYTAKVRSGTKTRAMKDPVDTGDCNACHTQDGTKKAPGRVMTP